MWFFIALVLLILGLMTVWFIKWRGYSGSSNKRILLTSEVGVGKYGVPLAQGNSSGKRVVSSPQRARPSRYWGVRLVPPPGGTCCTLIRQLQGQSFARDEVPPLPLPGCTMLNCHCRFEYLSEARRGQDRRSGWDRRQQIRFDPYSSDRRSKKDRRRANRVWDYQYRSGIHR